MSRNNFLVKQLKFEIEFQEENDFKAVTSNITQLSNSSINSIFQSLADSILEDNEQIYINRIVLDIGEISFDNKQVILEKIRNTLKGEIQKSKAVISNKSRSNEILITHFLSKGYLPWWASNNDRFNAFLASNAYNEDLKSDLFDLITKNRSNFKRFMNALNAKNKAVFIKAYLKKNNAFYQKSVPLFVKLLDGFSSKMGQSNVTFIQYELLKALVKNPNKAEDSYNVVFTKIYEDMNIEWEEISHSILSNPKVYKPFSKDHFLKDNLNWSQKRSNKSKLAQIKFYIERGLLNQSRAFDISYISSLFSDLMKSERDSLAIVFSQLDIYNQPLRLIRVSKLINSENLLSFLVLIFEDSKGHLLRQVFSFLNSFELKGNSNETSFFYFIKSVLKLKSLSESKKSQFYKELMNLVSSNYRLDYKSVLTDFYFFSILQNSTNDFQSVIESYYLNETSEEEVTKLNHYMGQLKLSPTFSFRALLSAKQVNLFDLLKKYIEFFNRSVVSISWDKIDTEQFIFTHLTEQQVSGSQNVIITVLNAYATKNNVPFRRLVVAVLKQFYTKLSLSDLQNLEIIDFILLVSKPEIYNTLSKKEQLQINEIIKNNNLKNKLELVDYKLSSTSFTSDLEYLQELKHQDLFFKQTHTYLVQELQPAVYSDTKLKLNTDQLSQVVKIELKKYISANNQINFQNIIESIAATFLIDVNSLNIRLLKNVINKLSFETNDKILIRQINDTIFSFKNIKHTTKKTINSVFEINQKIIDNNLKNSILLDYIANSPLVVLKLNDKNYKTLINNLSSNKQKNYFLILNKILHSIPYQKKNEFSSILKYKALLTARHGNLSDEQFLLQLLDEISYLDQTLLKKIRANLTQSTDVQDLGVIDSISKQILGGTPNNLQLLDTTPLQFKPINSFSHRDFEFFMNLKNELITDGNQKFANYDTFNTIEEIVETDSKLLEFLNLYVDDYEILIEFAQTSFKDPVISRLQSLSKSKNLKLFELEKELIALQKSTSFTILTSIEFRTILRVYILKSLAYIHKNKKIIISEFTLNFIETLSKNRKLNYRGTSDIASEVIITSSISKQIKAGVVSFFDKNKFQSISNEVKHDEYFKNIVSFFLKTNKVPDWSDSEKLSLEEALSYIKIRVSKSDSLYIKELFLEKTPTAVLALAFKDKNIDFRIEVLKLLELSNTKSYSIQTLYENIIKLDTGIEEGGGHIFEQILLKNLWKNPSLLHVLDALFLNNNKIKFDKKSSFIKRLKNEYPSLELVLKPIKKLDANHKIDLIRYFIESAQLPKVFQLNLELNFQLLKAYATVNRSQLKLLLNEFSTTPNVSKNFIEISSNAIFVELLLEELEDKNMELKQLFELLLKPVPKTPKTDNIVVYDLVLTFLIAPKIIQKSNFIAFLKALKFSSTTTYETLITVATKLVSDAIVADNSGILMSSLTLVPADEVVSQKAKELPAVLIKETAHSEFDTFIKDLRYFVEFNSFSRTSSRTHSDKFYTSIFKFKSNLILKKQLYNWGVHKSKIFNLFKLIPENEVSNLLEFIHPDQLNLIKTFNSILKKIEYTSIQESLKLDSLQKFTYKLLNTWSNHSIVINTPETIFHSLLDEYLVSRNIEIEQFITALETINPTLNSKQKLLVKSITQKAIISKPSKINEDLPDVEETEEHIDLEENVYIKNAGLIIVWPFLTTLFGKLGLVEGKEFKDDFSLQKAVLVLHYIVFGDTQVDETNMVLNKIMCGASPDLFVDTSIELNDMDKNIGDSLLTAVTKNWPQLNTSSIQTLREYFLKRDGIIKKMNENYMLKVEGNTFDVLLKSIPWNILMLQTAYMDNRLIVEWKY